jgi:hypothetical protein
MKKIILLILLIVVNVFGVYLTKLYQEKQGLIFTNADFESYKSKYIKELFKNVESRYETYYLEYINPKKSHQVSIIMNFDTVIYSKDIYVLFTHKRIYSNELSVLNSLLKDNKDILCKNFSKINVSRINMFKVIKNKKLLDKNSVIEDPCSYLFSEIESRKEILENKIKTLDEQIKKLN